MLGICKTARHLYWKVNTIDREGVRTLAFGCQLKANREMHGEIIDKAMERL